MKKSVYSLVLADDLVKAVDRIAYLKHTSRSNLVNQILAEYLSLSTPEKRMQDVLGRMEQLMRGDDDFQIVLKPTDSQMSVRSSIDYKYNPTVHYSVVLHRDFDDAFGELRVVFRTRNEELLQKLSDFFHLWLRIEGSYIAHLFPDKRIHCEIGPGKYTRELILPPNAKLQSDQELGDAATQYIRLFDEMLKIYLEYPPSEAASLMTKRYLDYLKDGAPII